MPKTHSLYEYFSTKCTLYLTRKAGKSFLRGRHFILQKNDSEFVIPLEDIRRIVLIGKPGIDSTIMYRMMRANIPIDWLDVFGRPMGQLTAFEQKEDCFAAHQQAFGYTHKALELARSLILAKFDNAREVLRKRVDHPLQWNAYRERIAHAKSPGELRGAEGLAARSYFREWTNLLHEFPWEGRKFRPAADPTNMLLSFGYGMLHNRFASALRHFGLNPRLGFFHATRGRHCALASDLMEPIRPFIDRVVLGLIRRKQLAPDQFKRRGKYCSFADNNAFSMVLKQFETMFAQQFHLYVYKEKQWISINRSINDCIDDISQNYARHISGQISMSPVRLRPCATDCLPTT